MLIALIKILKEHTSDQRSAEAFNEVVLVHHSLHDTVPHYCSSHDSLPISCAAGCDGGSGSVPEHDEHGADSPAASAGNGHQEAAGWNWGAGGVIGETWGRTEEDEGSGQRPGGLHWQAAGAHHGTDADLAAGTRQTKMTTVSDLLRPENTSYWSKAICDALLSFKTARFT